MNAKPLTLTLLLVSICVFSLSLQPFVVAGRSKCPSTIANDEYQATFFQDTSVYNTLKSFIWTKFDEGNKFGFFDTWCMQDCFSFTILLQANGDLKIQQFSKYTPGEIKKLIEKGINELNSVDPVRKPFIAEW